MSSGESGMTATAAPNWTLTLGANVERGGAHFRVWAPDAERVDVVLAGAAAEQGHALERVDGGYHEGVINGARAGTRYKYRIGDALYPDPASRAQPDGVHGWSEIVDPAAFPWTDDAWTGASADDLVIYELHVGAFTGGGTFDSAIERLDHLVELGITAVEVMPIASFSGSRNWGY